MKHALPILLAGCALCTPAAAQVNPKLRVTEIQTRVPPIADLSKHVKASPSQWKIDPSLLRMLPQTIAANIAKRINSNMAGKSVGFAVTVVMPGGASASTVSGMARSAPDANPRAWTDSDRINIASVSKTITAVAIVRAASAKGTSLDTKAYTLLPADWTYSAAFKTISVRELLTHNSGIRDCGPSNAELKTCAAKDWKAADKNTAIDIYTKYSNANYAYLRWILPRIVDGKVPSETLAGPRYWVIVNDLVIKPAGMGGADCASPTNPALSYVSTKDNLVYNSTVAANYDFTTLKPGVDWGDNTPVCGSQGWNLSSRQLATFANALWATSKLLPAATVAEMRQQGQGMMYSDFGGGLTAYGHNGYFPPANGGELRALALTFNNGVSVGMLVNSRYHGDFYADIANAVRAEAK
ncbi:serine hydrolase [Sphingomonas sp. LM7]|uniref:serine hydrolase domain-containing protein n=1 Tax=Sphingomonas sp. LM7 TaxID=1938607 RepID=UPI000983B5A7|nr:serine hydrolase [Sphingomonas sp. LM7]AQR74442.1 hypothetical protein BXU08_12955 [Sphingomonas sp. LM7]